VFGCLFLEGYVIDIGISQLASIQQQQINRRTGDRKHKPERERQTFCCLQKALHFALKLKRQESHTIFDIKTNTWLALPMAKKIPNSLFALTFLLAAAGSAFLLPTVSAFSSGRTSSNSNAIDPFSSFEEKGLDRSVGAGRDFSRLTPDEAMQLIDLFIIQVAEDFAEDATKKCHALRTPIDYNAVVSEVTLRSAHISR